MTIITEPVVNIAGLADNDAVTFFVGEIRRRASGHGIVTPKRVPVVPVNKVLTTPELNPGQAMVRIGNSTYEIDIPDSATPVALMPLIEAGLPAPGLKPDFVFNGGGIARAETMTLTEYSSAVKDPATLYFLYS